MEFLGHQIGGDVITLSSDNLEKVRKTPHLTTKKQVRSFQGLVRYYRDHIPVFSEISAPLSDLPRTSIKAPDLMKLFVLRTDANGVRVAAVRLQANEGKLYPVDTSG